MPKTMLIFNLPEDKYELELAQKAWNFKSTLDALDDSLRSIVKYDNVSMLRDKMDEEENKELTDGQIITAAHAFRSLLSELKKDNDAYMSDE